MNQSCCFLSLSTSFNYVKVCQGKKLKAKSPKQSKKNTGKKLYALRLELSAQKIFRCLYRRCPPLPIPNREVKPARADGTAVKCGRVGRCQILSSLNPVIIW